jgi:predicted ATPase/DNA-binding winged helix-turn-helix (wHTH) protein
MIPIGPFELDVGARELRCGSKPVPIGSRAFDILVVLAAARGQVVTKDELLAAVWPHTVVEENNLQVHLSALRKVLGSSRQLIVTVQGRGYQLAPQAQGTAALEREAASPARLRGVPSHQSRLVGREAALLEIAALLEASPVLTLVGAGGIGKTSLAVNLAHSLGGRFRDGVRFVELAALSDPDLVCAAVAEACELPLAGAAVSAECLAASLADRHCLVVLDNAEHVIEAVARLVSALTGQCGELRWLVTSREPLRIGNEVIFRVPPLDVPRPFASLENVLSQSAVQLFLRRARALEPSIGEGADSIQRVGDICRRLDGIPLAIELAAARAATLGIDGVYSRLDDRLRLLTGGHRTALPRHQTLRATFDWSYALLDPAARKVFRRLGVFAGFFTLESACAIAVDPDVPIATVVVSIGELISKSLLNVQFEGGLARYQLPESTSMYAAEKLRDEGEMQQIVARHRRILQQRFEQNLHESSSAVGRGRQVDLAQTRATGEAFRTTVSAPTSGS